MADLVNIPKSVSQVIYAMVKRHHSDIASGVRAAERAVRELPDFPEFEAIAMTYCVQQLFYRERHQQTWKTKRQAGSYGGPAKVVIGKSEAVLKVYRSIYDLYFIGKTRLGDIRGADIPGLCNLEEARADGHKNNADLLRWAAENGVKGEKRIRDVVPEKKLRAAWKRFVKPKEELGETGT